MSPSSARRAIAAFAVALLLAPIATPARADPLKRAQAVPAEVTEVVSGGSWSEGKQQGGYRAMLVMTGAGSSFALQAFVQWVALSEDGSAPRIVRTVPVKEINDRKLTNAFLFLDAEKDNEIVLTVSTFDPKTDKESAFNLVATAPGKYAMKD